MGATSNPSAGISHHLSPTCSSFYHVLRLKLGILRGRFSFKELPRTYAHMKDTCECTKPTFSFSFFYLVSPRICWITPVLLEVARGCLSLFRELLPDKLPLTSVWVSILLMQISMESSFRKLPPPVVFIRHSYCPDRGPRQDGGLMENSRGSSPCCHGVMIRYWWASGVCVSLRV